MGCFQKGPKATVGRVQCLEAPPGGSTNSLALLGHQEASQHHKRWETTALSSGT